VIRNQKRPIPQERTWSNQKPWKFPG